MIWVFTEKSNFYVGEFRKKQFNIEGGLPKKGRLVQFADLGGGGCCCQEKEGGGVFEWGVNTPMHTMYNLVLKL